MTFTTLSTVSANGRKMCLVKSGKVTLSSLPLASARRFVTYRGTTVNLPRRDGKLTAARRQTYRGAAVSDEARTQE